LLHEIDGEQHTAHGGGASSGAESAISALAEFQKVQIRDSIFFWSFLNATPIEESLSQLTHKELFASSSLLWGKSPEIQSLSSSHTRKATSSKYGGTRRWMAEMFLLVCSSPEPHISSIPTALLLVLTAATR